VTFTAARGCTGAPGFSSSGRARVGCALLPSCEHSPTADDGIERDKTAGFGGTPRIVRHLAGAEPRRGESGSGMRTAGTHAAIFPTGVIDAEIEVVGTAPATKRK